MMGKEKDGLQRALGDREREISSLLRYLIRYDHYFTEIQSSSVFSDMVEPLIKDTLNKGHLFIKFPMYQPIQ